MAIASLLAIATTPLQRQVFLKTKHAMGSAAIMTFLLAVLFFGPIVYFIVTISSAIATLNPELIGRIVETGLKLLTEVPEPFAFIQPYLDQITHDMDVKAISQQVLGIFGALGAKSAVFLKDVFLILVFFFFANLYGYRIGKYLRKALPLNESVTQMMFNETASVLSVTIYSTVIVAAFEGTLFAVMIGFFGYDVVLMGILYAFASLIPIIGGAVMWIPLALYEIYLGHMGNALFIALYTIIMISIIADTFIKPIIIDQVNTRLLHSVSSINPLIIFFAMVAGLSTYGFWGVILGPAVTALFISLLNVFYRVRNNEINCGNNPTS